MKKKDIVTLIAGMALGAVLTGGAAAAGILAEPSWSPIYVDGQQVQMTAYNIAGNNYVKLRDIGKAVGFNVYFEHGVQVDSGAPYTGTAPISATTQAPAPAETQAVRTTSAESIRVSCYKEDPLAAGGSSSLIISPGGVEYTVTSSNPAVATVELALGKVWKVNAVSSGTATITATAPDGRSGSVLVTVQGEQTEEPLDLSANMDIRLEMIRLINEVRRANGRSELPADHALMNAAQDCSAQCLLKHSPYESKTLPKYGWQGGAGFNLTAFTIVSPESIARTAVANWAASPGHLQTMLREEVTCVGTGVTIDGGKAYCHMAVGDPEGINAYA